MEIPNQRIIDLIIKHLTGDAGAEERAELDNWLFKDPEHEQMLERFERSGDWREDVDAFGMAMERSLETQELVMAKSARALAEQRASVRRMWGVRLVAASLLIALVGGGTRWFYGRKEASSFRVAKREELAPGRNRATLILADRKEIELDAAHTGSLAQQGNAEVQKFDSTLLTYSIHPVNHKPDNRPGDVAFNTVVTPRAGQYTLRLSDGTLVHLNAQSSLKFPVDFDSKERRVVLQGEGYFEVARDPTRPFRVDLGNGKEITVLGTRFDVRDYEDDPSMSATLLEGAIRVSSGGHSASLAVDQRASIDSNGAVNVKNDMDAEASIAWTHGLFRFTDARLVDVMRQMSRWYDLDVTFQGLPPEVPVTVSINRNVSAWEVLDALKQITGMKYKVEGKKIIVLP